MHWLIPYVQLQQPDPALYEFTYGDSGARARQLKSSCKKGDYVFFHIGRHQKRYVTAYYVVDRVLDTTAAGSDPAIRTKYRNPHLLEFAAGHNRSESEQDAILFGDPITSRILYPPLSLERELIDRLSLGVKYPANRTEMQALSSATRQWRSLTDTDKDLLLKAIEVDRGRDRRNVLRSTEEVAETLEKDIEDYLAEHPELIGKSLKLRNQQRRLDNGRLDLLFEDDQGDLTVVEIKYGWLGREALRQVHNYITDLRSKHPGKKVQGILVGAGVMPGFAEDFQKQQKIKILTYGWSMAVRPWSAMETGISDAYPLRH